MQLLVSFEFGDQRYMVYIVISDLRFLFCEFDGRNQNPNFF
jgi:hypothetical protein